VLEKDGKDQLGRSAEKWSINWSTGMKEHPTHDKTKEGELDWSHLA
jgi:hypothetical protein